MNNIQFPIDTPFDLDPIGSWPASRHRFDQTMADAVNAALAAQRPLLVRGEPGTGKSQLARAVAQHTGRLFISEVVHARSEAQDLQWHFDAVGRLGEAQALGATGAGDIDCIRAQLSPERFLAPGALWWLFDWEGADRLSKATLFKHRRPLEPEGWNPKQGSVLLIDEIDKADADLPNGLLETLGNGSFTVPWRDEAVCLGKEIPPPLVLITTNEERELPAAFVRRCFVLHLRLPDDDPEYADASDEERRQAVIDWLVERGRDHFGEGIDEAISRKAAGQLWQDRQKARQLGVTRPGQAEFIDLLRALDNLARGDKAAQERLLKSIQDFALKKFAGQFE